VEQILERLDDRFALLTGGRRAALPRHQTLRMTIDWSYDLLTQREQSLLRRLSAFASRFTPDDVQSVCTDDASGATAAFEDLASLVDKSLLIRDDYAGRACYRLHETMREYATVRLRELDEGEPLSRRCVEYYRTACLSMPAEGRYRLPEWLPWVELEIDNIRAVLQRCLARDDRAPALEITVSLRYYWITHGTSECLRWLDQLLTSGGVSPRVTVRALFLRGWLSLLQGEPAVARPWLARAIATARDSCDAGQLVEALSMAANVEDVSGNAAGARSLLDEAAARADDLDDYAATMEVIQARAVHAFFQGDMAAVAAASAQGTRLSRDAGDLFYLESMVRNFALIAMMSGDLDEAKAKLSEALRIARQIDHRISTFFLLSGFGWHAAASGQPRLAARLLGAAETLGAGAGAVNNGPHTPFLDQARASAMQGLGSAKFAAEFDVGARMSRHDAVRLALGEPEHAEAPASSGVAAAPLARREVEVAALVAQGLSNKQIAARLFISERTVATHVGHILDKLGFNSRAQIAGWVSSGR
jgi:DNA-binding CsgD family transcriptional regulator